MRKTGGHNLNKKGGSNGKQISILFYGKMQIKKRIILITIYLRITVNGKRIDQSINRTIEPSQWSKAAGKMKGTSAESRAFNGFLDVF